jgi:hypothetical protein
MEVMEVSAAVVAVSEAVAVVASVVVVHQAAGNFRMGGIVGSDLIIEFINENSRA